MTGTTDGGDGVRGGSGPEPEMTIAELTARLSRLAGQEITGEDALQQMADLEVASEELRVVEEEVRHQQDQLNRLLARYETEQRWRSELSELVPIGLCVTDDVGKVLDANPALATQLQVGVHRLRGKPLTVFLDPGDKPAFRSALRLLGPGGRARHRDTITLRGRESSVRAELFGFPVTPAAPGVPARIQWVLVPESRAEEQEFLVAPEPPGRPSPARPHPAGSPHDEALQIATALAALTALPGVETDDQRLVTEMASLVRGAVPGSDWVSLTLGSPLEATRMGTDATEAQDFDGCQWRARQGPCIYAYETGTTVLADDVTTDSRWPRLAELARRGPVRGVLAVPIRESRELTGVVSLYSRRPGAFDSSSRRIAEVVAAAVSGALYSATQRRSLQELAGHLRQALTSRAVIDQAKGMLMGRLGVDADEAFARLVTLSNRLNVKVRDLATLVTQGHLEALIREGG